MSVSIVNTFFNQNPKYLNDIYDIDYVANHERLYGWNNFTELFCDSMMLWLAYDATENYDADDTNKNSTFYKKFIKPNKTIIKGVLNLFYDEDQYSIKYVRKGSWEKYDDISSELAKHPLVSGYLGFNVLFCNIKFNDLYHKLEEALIRLRHNNILLRTIDITVDCGYISTRKIIEEYILSSKLVDNEDIVDDRRLVGDNCISFYQYPSLLNNTKTRVKIYNKFIQVLESCEVTKQLGSSLHYLVTSHNTEFTEKLKRFRELGYSRIEVSVHGSTLFGLESYKEAMNYLINVDLAGCPTFKVPLQKQWSLIVDRLTQVVTVYVKDVRVFAYCHWWNSFTKKKQGVRKTGIDEDLLECLLANFSFNERIIHCFHLQVKGKTYEIVKHDRYKRVDGSTAMTLVPAIRKSLFPSRVRPLVNETMFKDVGLDIYKNVYIEWPVHRIQRSRKNKVANIVKVSDSFDMSAIQEVLSLDQTLLTKIERPQSALYRSDYGCLEAGNSYTVNEYGYGLFRGTECLHLVLEEGQMVRCSNEMRSCLEPKILEGARFMFEVVKITKVRGTHRTQCQIV